jgi:hypothetical protein
LPGINNLLSMKINSILSLLLVALVVAFSGCSQKNKELKQDVANMADAMCKITGVMNKIRAADPNDSVAQTELRMEEKQYEIEMTVLNHEFQAKYKDKLQDKDFMKEYSSEFKKAILNCKNLSKEDRDRYSKEVE